MGFNGDEINDKLTAINGEQLELLMVFNGGKKELLMVFNGGKIINGYFV